ncbi:ABC transporter ATP-binding protein [Listeria monocytogenes]|uniref:ABC transporter ATP-binding protein n=1 Tax=Listeria monocytogenes TaxID=1639 RepID=UPI0010D1617B|nr:ABC transporter ATP-binding protein [Listeria monocytogenes]EAD2799873.1 ATP-binding cassette domain-containing protein [Listeria monocytogenes]EHL5791752.1 ABC transporter ATP-binding protein [Listeria monocytogenes]EJG4559871.1 ABC transporter ATP-binding protein [Listeria monocytogenes]EJG4571983.1 ABC transporter ATP-binding protein [Listeria monocytogenes]EJI3953974.1 ABC transporter ATP-binding protein [Listeria monocytogenes]
MTLELHNVTKNFGTKVAVNDLSFRVEPGKILGLIGQNGAGKTTTFRLILHFLEATSGKITWDDKEVSKIDPNIIGYLPEERGLYPNVTIEEQLIFFAELKGYPKQKIKAEIDGWLERAEIVGKKTDLIKTLSKGNQQKIQLLSTIIHQPKLVILDEPFSGLDPVNAEILKKFVFDLRASGAAIIFSSHRMENVEELCDSLLMLKKGNVVLQGTTESVKSVFGRKRILIESRHTAEELAFLPGVLNVKTHRDGILQLEIAHESDAEKIFEYVTKDGFIQTFSLQAPTLEEIFKWKAGESNE